MSAEAGEFQTLLVSESSAFAGRPAEIVFESAGRVISVDARGQDRRILSSQKRSMNSYLDSEVSPAISLDGERLAYLEEVEVGESGSVRQQLVVASRSGSPSHVVMQSDREGLLFSPKWMPGDRLVIGVSEEPEGTAIATTELVSMDLDGSERKVEVRRWLRIGRRVSGNGYLTDFDPSPDGNKILITSLTPPSLASRLEIIDVSSGTHRVVRRGAGGGSWSPASDRIVFESTPQIVREGCIEISCSSDLKLYLMRADGSLLQRLTREIGNEYDGTWSPDGKRIAFSSDRNSRVRSIDDREIYTIGVDGKCLTWITNGSPASSNPDWSPEVDRTFAPKRCGSRGLRPNVDLLPEARPLVNGSLIRWPRLWLGPVFRGNAQASLVSDGRELTYSDCVRFQRARCPRYTYDISSDDVCIGWAEQLARFGEVGRIFKRRGALVFGPVRGPIQEAVVLSGGQVLMVLPEDRIRGRSVPFDRYLRAIDALRPVGRPGGGRLDPPVVTSELIGVASRVARVRTKTGSLTRTAQRLEISPRAAASWIKVSEALRRYGPIQTTTCSGD